VPPLLFQADEVIRCAELPDAPAARCVLQIKPFTSVETIRGYTTPENDNLDIEDGMDDEDE